ncbi:MAG: hypothetical protein ACMG57_00540 [Candidatus Dojkabacteria bacterium]
MNSIYSDTIDVGPSTSNESFDYQNFERKCLKVLDDFKFVQRLLLVEESEKLEILEHKMATVTLYKDLFRVQLEKILQVLLSKEISKIPNGEIIKLLQDVNLENIISFLENDIYLDGTSISNELKNIIINILKNINFIAANWEFICTHAEQFDEYGIGSISSEIQYMLTDNISTFLGENIKLAETFLEGVSQKFNNADLDKLKALINENGFRKVEFGYELDFEKIKYLIYSAIRCKNQIANEREDTELFNLVVVLLINFRNNPGTLKIIEDIRKLYNDKPDILKHIDELTKTEISPRLIIENSPPIYSNVQHNLMYRIYEATDGGVKVHIFSIPYNRLEVEDSIDRFKGKAEEVISYPTSGNQIENTILSTLITSNLSLDDAINTHPTINRIGLDNIRNNDSVLNPIIDDLMKSFKPFVVKVIKDLPQIIANPTKRAMFVKNYEDTIRAIDLYLKDKEDIKSNLDEEELSEVQSQVLQRVMDGQSLEFAVQDIVGDKAIELETKSDGGDCVQFETKIQTESKGEISQNLSKYDNGTVLSTKAIERNGFKSEITEMVVDGKKINMVRCLVCQKQFDTCNEKCPECETPRAMQYDAIYNGNKREGKAAIKQLNTIIAEREARAKEELERRLTQDSNQPIDPGIGGKIAGAFTGFLNVLSFGTLDEENSYIES